MSRTQQSKMFPLDEDGLSSSASVTDDSEIVYLPVRDNSSQPRYDFEPLPMLPLPPPRVSPPSSSSSDEENTDQGKYSERKESSPMNSERMSTESGPDQESGDSAAANRRAQGASSYFGDSSEKDGLEDSAPARTNLKVGHQISLLERVRRLKTLSHKYKQYNLLKKHFDTLKRVETTLDWYEKPDEKSIEDLSGYDVMPCECHLHDPCRFLGQDEKVGMDGAQTETPRGGIKEETAPSNDPGGEHNVTCNIKRLCMYFAGVAKYFTGEEIDPDLFLLDNPPQRRYPETEDFIKPAVLYQDRKIVRLRLRHEIDSLLENVDEDMNEESKERLYEINQTKESIYNCLRRLLKELTEYYNDSTDDELSESPNAAVKKKIKKYIKINLDELKHQIRYLKYLQINCDSCKKIGHSEPRNNSEELNKNFEMDETHPVESNFDAQKNRLIKHKMVQPKSENADSNDEPQEKKWREAEQSLSELSLEEATNSGDQLKEKVYYSDLEVANNIVMS